MANDLFDGNNSQAGEAASVDLGFDIMDIMGVRSNQASASEQVAKLLEQYETIRESNVRGYPAKMISLRPEWIGEKELVVLYLQANGKTAITPILFGAESVEELMADSQEHMVRCAAYNIIRPSDIPAGIDPSSRSDIQFLNLAYKELIDAGHIAPQANLNPEHLDLAGCIIVDGETKFDEMAVIAAAVSEMRACLWGLHGTSNFSAQEKDLNYLNHTRVTTVVDLSTEADAHDILGNPIFSPLKVQLSRYGQDALSATSSKQVVPYLDVHGYLDFRPLTPEEIAAWPVGTTPAPMLIPQFIINGVSNRRASGVVTPTMLLNGIAGIANFVGENMFKMLDQTGAYSTTVDTACSSYDWNQVGALIKLAGALRNAPVTEFTPVNPVALWTGTELPTPTQRVNAYSAIFGEMEILMDVPQSGEMAKVRQQLLQDLPFYHHKLTGQHNKVVDLVGVGGIVPHGTYLRSNGKSHERRDIREIFNALGMADKFQAGAQSMTDHFMNGTSYAAGHAVGQHGKPDREIRDAYNFINEVLIEDGSFKLTDEIYRAKFSNEYLKQLTSDLAQNAVKFEMRHSGGEIIARLNTTKANQTSINFRSLYR